MLLELLPFGEVPNDSPDADNASRTVTFGFGPIFDPSVLTRSFVAHAVFSNDPLTFSQQSGFTHHLVHVFRMHQLERMLFGVCETEWAASSQGTSLNELFSPTATEIENAVAQEFQLPGTLIRIDGHGVHKIIGVVKQRPKCFGCLLDRG